MSMKTMEIDPKLDPMFQGLIRKVEPALERVLGDVAERVDVAWGVGATDAEGEQTVRLSLTDDHVCRSADFTAWDLEDDLRLRRGLRRVWDQVQAERVRIHRKRLLESLAETGEG